MEELLEQYMETGDLVQLQIEEDVITPSQGRNLIYKFLVKTLLVLVVVRMDKKPFKGFDAQHTSTSTW